MLRFPVNTLRWNVSFNISLVLNFSFDISRYLLLCIETFQFHAFLIQRLTYSAKGKLQTVKFITKDSRVKLSAGLFYHSHHLPSFLSSTCLDLCSFHLSIYFRTFPFLFSRQPSSLVFAIQFLALSPDRLFHLLYHLASETEKFANSLMRDTEFIRESKSANYMVG